MDGKGGMPSLRETIHGHTRAGHELTLVLPKYQLFYDTPTEIAVDPSDAAEVIIAKCRWAPALMAVRAHCRKLGGGKEPPYILRWLLNLLMYAFVTASLFGVGFGLWRKNRKFELVYAHNQYAALAGRMLGRLFGAPNVTRLYGTFLADLMNRPAVSLRYPTAAAGFRVPSDLLICGNDGTRGDVVARKMGISSSRFRFWQNGVDLPESPSSCTRDMVAQQYASLGLRKKSKWIISCSRLSYWKRIDRMIKALRTAVDDGSDCQLLVIGSGPEEKKLRALTEELDLQSHVVWFGPVEHDTIWDLMSVADLFAITNDVTNRCNPVYEAICAGLPIVSIEDVSTADLLTHGENSLLSDRDDFKAIGNNISRILSNPKRSEQMRHAQKARRKTLWSWQERMDVEIAELESLVNMPNQAEGKREAV